MPNNNIPLHKAKKNKNDEFYTQYKDVEKEMQYRQNDFIDKVVWCPCDDYKKSNFVKYFKNNFNKLGLKFLISSCIENKSTGTDATFYIFDGTNEKVEPLDNGSFDSQEILLKINKYRQNKNVVVATNPPFSLVKTFVPYILKQNFDLLCIVPVNCVTYVDVFPLFKNNKLRVSYHINPWWYIQVNGTLKRIANAIFITSLHVNYNHIQEWRDNTEKIFRNDDDKRLLSPIILCDNEKYPIYNFNKCNESNMTFAEKCFISVPITYPTKRTPDNFQLMNFSNDCLQKDKDGNIKKLYKRLIYAINFDEIPKVEFVKVKNFDNKK